MSNEGLSNLLHEERTFAPGEEFVAQANGTQELYDREAADVILDVPASSQQTVYLRFASNGPVTAGSSDTVGGSQKNSG